MDPILGLLSFLFSVGLFISWCVVVSRLGSIREDTKDQIEWLKHSAELQKRQMLALEELVKIHSAPGNLPAPISGESPVEK